MRPAAARMPTTERNAAPLGSVFHRSRLGNHCSTHQNEEETDEGPRQCDRVRQPKVLSVKYGERDQQPIEDEVPGSGGDGDIDSNRMGVSR